MRTKQRKEGKLNQIDINNIVKPEKYEGNVAQFEVWIDRLRDLMTNRHANWTFILDAITKRNRTKLDDYKIVFLQ